MAFGNAGVPFGDQAVPETQQGSLDYHEQRALRPLTLWCRFGDFLTQSISKMLPRHPYVHKDGVDSKQ
jgi:hypothetical protein